jgi:hypothetical protein
MNHHAYKVDYAAGRDEPGLIDQVFYGALQEVHQCPRCGNVELRRATSQLLAGAEARRPRGSSE